MRLFDIVNGVVQMNPTTLWIPEFKALWDRDKSKDKKKATSEISYIVFMYAYTSPYSGYSEKERERKVKLDCFGKLAEEWKPDEYVKKATKKFLSLQETPTLRLLKAANIALDKIKEYYDNVTPDMANEIIKNTKELGSLVKSLDILTRQVEKEQLENSNVRGGQSIGLFEL